MWPHMTVVRERRLRAEAAEAAARRMSQARRRCLELVGLGGLRRARREPALRRPAAARGARARDRARAAASCCSTSRSSNLDAKLRERMRIELRELQQRLGITAVYVTHDQQEAMVIADRDRAHERRRASSRSGHRWRSTTARRSRSARSSSASPIFWRRRSSPTARPRACACRVASSSTARRAVMRRTRRSM